MFFTSIQTYSHWLFYYMYILCTLYMYKLHRSIVQCTSTLWIYNIMVYTIGVAIAIRSLHFFFIFSPLFYLFLFFILTLCRCLRFPQLFVMVLSQCTYACCLTSVRAIFVFTTLFRTHVRLDTKTCSLNSFVYSFTRSFVCLHTFEKL